MSKRFVLIILFVFTLHSCSSAFALLSHQAIIDATWKSSIKPLLHKKYPDATEEELKVAYSYCYGGALLPDIGYAPFGSKTFTNLIHYVRSGDFVEAVISESKDLNEYAFGLGLLCHYEADQYGHSLGTNKAVALLYPELKEQYGNTVDFEKDRSAHTRVEFGFDVIQTAKGNYNPDAKKNFVGFLISERVLEQAFKKTYGMELKSIFKDLHLAIETFRFFIKRLMPQLAKNAWRVRHAAILELDPKANKKSYTARYERKKYRELYGRPGPRALFYSVLISIVPKVGPVSGLKYKEPDERVEKLFNESFKAIVNHYEEDLTTLHTRSLSLVNVNFDTGKKTASGDYKLTDETYYVLLQKLDKNNFKGVDKDLRKNLLAFYANPEDNSSASKKHKLQNIKESLNSLNSSAQK